MPLTEAATFFQFMFGCHSNGTCAKDLIEAVCNSAIDFDSSLLYVIVSSHFLGKRPLQDIQRPQTTCPGVLVDPLRDLAAARHFRMASNL